MTTVSMNRLQPKELHQMVYWRYDYGFGGEVTVAGCQLPVAGKNIV
jgi:hypothetical protein